jgi:hypothetical protein
MSTNITESISHTNALSSSSLIFSSTSREQYPQEDNNQRKENCNGKKGKGSLSSNEGKQFYEWLHMLEVDHKNNKYVAEAASSKFLTGKLNNEDQVVDSVWDCFFAAEFSRVDISPENKHEHRSFGHERLREHVHGAKV